MDASIFERQLGEVEKELGRVAILLTATNTKLDAHTSMIADYIRSNESKHSKFDERLQDHDRDINQAKGAKTMLLVVAGAISTAIGLLLKKF